MTSFPDCPPQRSFVLLVRACLLALLLPVLSACAPATVYRSMQGAAHQSCLRQPPAEYARCEEGIRKEDFDTYQRGRARKPE